MGGLARVATTLNPDFAMITVKILCGCGQKYAFDVEPYHGRMPATVQCPICKADGTAAANEIIARTLPPQPIATAGPPPVAPAPLPLPSASGLRIGGASSTSAAPPPAPIISAATSPVAASKRQRLQAELEEGAGGEGDKWKWWYYIIAGIGIIGYDAFMLYDTHRLKFVGGIFLGIFCICIGVWDFNRKRAIRKQLREG